MKNSIQNYGDQFANGQRSRDLRELWTNQVHRRPNDPFGNPLIYYLFSPGPVRETRGTVVVRSFFTPANAEGCRAVIAAKNRPHGRTRLLLVTS